MKYLIAFSEFLDRFIPALLFVTLIAMAAVFATKEPWLAMAMLVAAAVQVSLKS